MIGQRVARRRRSTWSILFGAMLVVLALLGAFSLFAALVRALDRPPRPAPGELLYATTFDAYNQEWAQYPGLLASEAIQGALCVSSDSPREGAYSELDRDFSDFDMRANATWVASSTEFSELGLLFRYQDSANFYIFKLGADATYSVELVKDGQTEVLSARRESPAVRVELGQVNQMRVVGQGGSFRFYVNDQALPVCPKGSARYSTWDGEKCASNDGPSASELVDLSFDIGKIGLGVKADEAGGEVTPRQPGGLCLQPNAPAGLAPLVQAAFDNVLIFGPEAPK